MTYQTIRFANDGGLARITLARPDNANALDLTMMRELMEAAIACDEDPSIRAILIDSEGRLFCAGGDLAEFARAGDGLAKLLKEATVYLHAAISRLVRTRAPVIAAVQGHAAGAGFSLAMACDLVLAATSARFTMAYTRAGLVPDGGSTYFLPRLIGRRRTLELMLTNRTLSAEEALGWGLVSRVVADDQLADEARYLAREIALGPTGAFGGVKRIVLRSESETLESQMEIEARAIADAARSADGQEGIRAFLAKRPAKFTGR
jgi:2-(1,2-epoxy-1,2-dihydrophenyl)acetyl-CoA isomerase